MAKWRAARGKKPIESQPEPEQIHDDLYETWTTWHQLAAKRPVGMAAGAIPLSEMRCMLDELGVRGPLRLRWVRLWEAMDAAYLHHLHKKKEADDGEPRTADRRKRHAARRGSSQGGSSVSPDAGEGD